MRQVIEEFQPSLNICGHIHEARATDEIGNTKVVNPGELSEGFACLINVEDSDEYDTKVNTQIISL
ncbi:MAG: hypothetical protein K8E24_011515 [Methanobacterium paludis]|nr:hypothetical protein [Methanobacterium paludis]